MTPRRYHTALVVLHWLLALMILTELGLGSTLLADTPNDMPEKIMALRAHMATGNLIMILTIIRFVIRKKTDHPASVSAGSPILDKLIAIGHNGLYAFTGLMVLSGLALAWQTELPRIVFDGIGTLPADFSGASARAIHGWIGKALIALVAGHVLAALYHHFVRKDGLLRRMGGGPRYLE